ncbi:hypothetical protein DV737_g4392, partial [Chaetothyriales sp. CBS 132003]
MSSASAVAPASQTATTASTAHTATASNAATRTTNMRSSSQVKNPDGGARRQSPIDAASRRGPTQKAWAGGANSLTQRAPPAPQSNGVAAAAKASKLPAAKDTGLSERHAHDRSVTAFGAALGSFTTLATKTGDRYCGFMAGAWLEPSDPKIMLKMTKKLASSPGAATANGLVSREAALVGSSPEYAMIWDVRDLVEIDFDDLSLVESARMANGSSSKFRTDADISGNLHRGARPLQKWMPDGPDETDCLLDTGSAGAWDQFATFKQMTGIESTYHENEYTTALDKNSLSYKLKEAEAERVEREILSTASTNVHINEERGRHGEHGADDEEAKYSGVRRSQPPAPVPLAASAAPNKYTPPAKRAPTAQPTVPGAPVDPAILSTTKPTPPAAKSDNESDNAKAPPPAETTPQKRSQNTSVSPQRPAPAGGQTEGVEDRLLNSFREFKDTEKQKLLDRKRQQANQDRTAKLNELLRFSRTFKLKTPVPTDLVGILAKDPVKQEAIIEKAKKEHEESARKASEVPQLTATPDRQQMGIKGPSQQAALAGRGSGLLQRPAGSKALQAHQTPAPIPILDGRAPPAGPTTADAASAASPQRSSVHTPTSAASSKFNLSVKAAEFRPTAPSFNPAASSSNAPSSPASVQRTTSVSRAGSPSSFFGAHKPKPRSGRPSIADKFNPIAKMKAEVAAKVAGSESSKAETGGQGPPHKDYAANGGIPYAYQTVPRWTVRQENDDKTYRTPFERPAPPTPQTSRAGATPHMAYPSHVGHLPPGQGHMAHGGNAQQHMHANGPHHYAPQYDDGHARPVMPMGPPYSSSNGPSRQTSAYASPLVPGAQLVYSGSQPYYAVNSGQMPMPMRYPGTPMHQAGQMAAPMMVHQQPNGFMPAPQQYNAQMSMYSPNPSHVYPQANGYGSPGRAPMMMQQGSQQSHHPGQPMMYTLSQGGPMGYPQQGQAPMGRGYGGQYGSSPQQPYGMGQRAMSSGYGQKRYEALHFRIQTELSNVANAVVQEDASENPFISQIAHASSLAMSTTALTPSPSRKKTIRAMPELTYLSRQWQVKEEPPLYAAWMASSEVDQKFLGHFAKTTTADNNYLSSFLFKVLGLSVILAEKLLKARRAKRLVLSYKLRASFLHIFVLFHNDPPVNDRINRQRSGSLSLFPEPLSPRLSRPPSIKTPTGTRQRSPAISLGGPVGGATRTPPGLPYPPTYTPRSVPGSVVSGGAAGGAVGRNGTATFLLPLQDYTPQASAAFKEANDLADRLLPGSHPVRLSVKVEYVAYIYDCLHDAERSRYLAKMSIRHVYEAQEGMDDESFEDAAEMIDSVLVSF